MNLKWIQKCRICGNPHLEKILDFGEMPNQGSFEFKNGPKPFFRSLPNITLRCDTTKQLSACGLIQNAVVVDPRVLYHSYGYSSGVSRTMVNWLETVAKKVEQKHTTYQSVFVDVGGNDSTFLSFFKDCKERILIDPSDIVKTIKDKSIIVYNECFPSNNLTLRFQGQVDFLSAIACFYDITDFDTFFAHFNLLMNKSAIGVFEVAYLPTVIKNLAYDGMVIEHANLFSLTSLEFLFNKFGWVIFDAEKTETNAGSLLFFVCRKGNPVFDTPENDKKLNILRFEEFEMAIDDKKTYEDFSLRVRNHAVELKNVLYSLKLKGKRIAIYGASTKLNLLLGYAKIGSELIDHAAERDPKKWGGRLLNGIPMISEEESRKNVDVYFCGPYHFLREIIQREANTIKNGVTFLFPLPEITLVNKDNVDKYVTFPI